MNRKTANQVTRVLNAPAFKKFLKGVPGVPSDVHKLISPGPVFNFKVDLEPLDRYSFKVWEDPGEICALLKELIDNILLVLLNSVRVFLLFLLKGV